VSDECLVGVDVGTQGTKAAMFSRSGECLAEAFVKSDLRYPGPGMVEEEPEAQLSAAARAIAGCLERSGRKPASVAALAVDGQMAGVIGIGDDGKSITPYDSWLDTRCAPYIDLMQKAAGDEVLSKCGAIPSFNHGPKILWWKHERPEIYARIASFVQPAAYVAMRLCSMDSRPAYIDHTYLHFSGFADNLNLKWDEALCREFEVDQTKLPRIVAPHDIVGRISREGARGCGLAEGTVVAAGCGDTAASFLSCGATEIGTCVDVAGTASVFAGTTPRFAPDLHTKTLACARSATPGLWHPYAYVNGGGLNLEWFRSQILGRGAKQTGGLAEAGPGEEDSAQVEYAELERLSAELPFGEADPFFVPHFGGRVMPSAPYLRGAWAGLEWSHTLGHLYRAMLEGVALEYGIYLSLMRELHPDVAFSRLRATGGGARNLLWNRIKASVCGMPVTQVVGSSGAPAGAAIIAGVGCGLLSGVAEASRAWVQTGETTEHEPELAGHFAARRRRYELLVRGLTELR